MDTGSLDLAVRAVAPTDGLFVLPADYDAPQSWRLVTRTDGVRVRVDYRPDATAEQIAAAEEVVLQFDFSAAAESARALKARRQDAITLLLNSDEPRDVALRAFIRDLYTQINDLRELHALARTQEPEIVGRVVAGIGGGLGDAP